VPQIVETVNKLGGVTGEQGAPRRYYATEDGIVQQLTLFDSKAAYVTEMEDSAEHDIAVSEEFGGKLHIE
jgi:hypothetical protein